jgi:hypothetical protein
MDNSVKTTTRHKTATRSVVVTARAPDQDTLERWRASYLRSYPPGGYNTTVSPLVWLPGGEVQCSAERSTSCD